MVEIKLGSFTLKDGSFKKKSGTYELTFEDDRGTTIKTKVDESTFESFSVGDLLPSGSIKVQTQID